MFLTGIFCGLSDFLTAWSPPVASRLNKHPHISSKAVVHLTINPLSPIWNKHNDRVIMLSNAAKFWLRRTDVIPLNLFFPFPQCKLIHASVLVYKAIVKCQYQSIIKAGWLEGTLWYDLTFKCSVNINWHHGPAVGTNFTRLLSGICMKLKMSCLFKALHVS